MKKVFSGILAMATVFSLCVTAAFAAGPGGRHCFADEDGDGVCDNSGKVCIYADADEDGVCDVCGAEHGTCLTKEGTAFVDEDGDGICDNCGDYHRCGMAGAGRGQNFVDEDGDGICDNYVSGQGRGGCGSRMGCGNGRRGGRGR